MKYALVSNNQIVNIIEWDGDTKTWQQPENLTVHKFEGGPISIGWLWNDGNPVDPNPPAPPPEPVQITPEQKLAASGLTVDELKQLLGIN